MERFPVKKTPLSLFLALALTLLLLFSLGAARSAEGLSVSDLLPAPGFAEGWVMKDTIKTHTEETLYKYINGEAELYYPYGFKSLATAVYGRSDNREIGVVADVYEMGSPIDAFGIYSRYRDSGEEPVNIGTEGFVNESQLLFAKNRYFVRLSPTGTVTMDKSVFLPCAQAIAARIPADPSALKLLDILKISDMVPQTETYMVNGLLGYAFFEKGLAADVNLDGKTVRIFVVLETSPQSSHRAFLEYKTYLEKSAAQFSMSKNDQSSTIYARDPLYKGLVLTHSGTSLIGVAKLVDLSKAVKIIGNIHSRMAAQ